MDKLSRIQDIQKRLRDKVEARCFEDLGYLIQVVNTPNNPISIGVPHVQVQGCLAVVTFDAVLFKPQKNDILDVIVTQVSEDYIKGKVGHAQAMVPRNKMPNSFTQYRPQGFYVFRGTDPTADDQKIDRGMKMRIRCFDVKTQLNFQMKIMGQIDEHIISSMQG